MESMEYSFAHDHLNYARMMPFYLHTMQQEAKEKLPIICEELEKGNFCVTKGVAGFTSIGPDHGIEQENRELKVFGGIVGITQKDWSLDKNLLLPSFQMYNSSLKRLIAMLARAKGPSIMK